jgi:uncharacterized protein
MPSFYFKDGNGKEFPIELEACSRTFKNFYHAIRKDNDQLITFHKDQLVIKYSAEELASIQRTKLKAMLNEAGAAELVVLKEEVSSNAS